MLKLLDKVSVWVLLVLALMLGVAPLGSQPHLLEKLGMLADGTLVRLIDIFDLFLHSVFSVLLIVKLVRMMLLKQQKGDF